MVSLNEEHNKFIFDVNESLLFEKGQEIEEMLSVSLEPDIVVQAYDDYIQIRGVIVLEGEYIKIIDDQHDTGDAYHPSIRYVERVIEQDERVNYFSHRFPVEISVPLYRVKDVRAIMAKIDSFDYEIVMSNKMNIEASLHIYGIDQAASPFATRERSDKLDRELAEAEVEKKSNPVKMEMQHENRAQPSYNDIERIDEQFTDREGSREEIAKKEELKNRSDKEEKKTTQTDEIVEEKVMKKQENRHDDDLSYEQLIEKEHASQEDDMEIQYVEKSDEETEIKDITFLTELFQHEAESYTKIKIYIAQENDTIESIAKRYEVPILQLIKDNNLMEESIKGGQLIKIVEHDRYSHSK